VLAVLTLFVGLASAQNQLTCSTNVSVTPQLRGEGFTEETGDFTITCTGGAALALGAPVPSVNISIFYNTTVTSRLLGTGTTNVPTEALLMIDEPGAFIPGFPNSNLPQLLCTTPATGCAAVVGPGNTSVTSTGGQAPNVYQGVMQNTVSLNHSIVFNGIPVLPPTSAGSRVFRITNVRIDGTVLATGGGGGATPVQTQILINPSGFMPITNSTPIVGYVTSSLTTSASSATGLNQCTTQTRTSVNTLTFTENFSAAFKTRVVAQSNTLYAGQLGQLPPNPNPGNQATPGGIYNSESNFVFPIGSATAGLADFGTRLKATFNNIPSGTRVWVSTANVNNNAFPVTAPSPIGGSAANGPTTFTSYALLINGENTSDGSTAPGSGFLPTITATDNGPNNGNVPIAEVPIDGTSKSGVAVWEVVNTNPSTTESFKFAVYLSYTSDTKNNLPLPGTSSVSLSYAPTTTSGAPSGTASIPRFAAASSAASSIFIINICRTVLLYPYVTSQAGFDTGIAISNTSNDNMVPNTYASNASSQSGTCRLDYFGGTTAAPTTPPNFSVTPVINAGTVYTNTLGTLAPNFQGYIFAVCNFQYAHGFAFISDVGARNLAMGYLALVIQDPGSNSRQAAPGSCIQSGTTAPNCLTGGEQDAH